MEKQKEYLAAAFTANGSQLDAKSVHLALCGADGVWKTLNFGIGVLFAEADFSTGKTAGETMVLDSPTLQRLENGKIGVTARLYTAQGEERGAASWETADLVRFERLPESLGADGPRTALQLDGEGTVSASVLVLTREEAAYLEKKLGMVHSVSVDPVEVRLSVQDTALAMPPLTARYSDGSMEQIPVVWDEKALSAVRLGNAGTYEVPGQAVVKEYDAPLVRGVADPVIRRIGEMYYLIGTNEFTEGKDLWIRCASSIEGLADAEKSCIFRATESGDHSGCNWAPELHEIGGKLCCLFASSTNGSWDHVQSRIMTCDGDPMRAESWSEPVRVCKQDGSPLIEQGITLDMTYFEAGGKSWYCWAQRTIDSRGTDSSDLMLAPVNPAQPDRLAGEPVLLCRPRYAWDRQHTEVDEGPHVLKHDGKLFLSFSGDSVSDYYCLGWLVADETADLLDPLSWKQVGYPVLGREHVEGERGPGHNSFTTDEYGRDVIVYHAKPNGGMRSCYVRTIHYAFDGTPLLYLTPERFLRPDLRCVTAHVIIE